MMRNLRRLGRRHVGQAALPAPGCYPGWRSGWIKLARFRGRSSRIEISIADSGPGVADQVMDTIFEPFVTTKAHGMGMGLSISRSIVESHGGSLRMARNLPSGAIFFFDLPTSETEASIDAE